MGKGRWFKVEGGVGSDVLCGQCGQKMKLDCLGSVSLSGCLSKFIFKERWDQKLD